MKAIILRLGMVSVWLAALGGGLLILPLDPAQAALVRQPQAQLGDQLAGIASWELPNLPAGYPYTPDPVVYLNQPMNVVMGLQNVSTQTCFLDYRLELANRPNLAEDIFVTVKILTQGSLNLGPSESWSRYASWDSATNPPGEYCYRVIATYPRGSPAAKVYMVSSPRFQVARVQQARFQDCTSDYYEYGAGTTVAFRTNACVNNTGNVAISNAMLQVVLRQYNPESGAWPAIALVKEQPGFVLPVGGRYALTNLGLISYALPPEASGTFRWQVRLADGTNLAAATRPAFQGAIQQGYLENALPHIDVERVAGEDANTNGVLEPGELGRLKPGMDKPILVRYNLAPRGTSLRAAGVFEVAPEAPLIRPLDLVFILDTSMTMTQEWVSLLGNIGRIIESVNQDASCHYDVYALEDFFLPDPAYQYYWVRGVSNAVKLLKPEGMCSSKEQRRECWGWGAAQLTATYPWRTNSLRMIFPVSDESPQCGNPWYPDDDAAIELAWRSALSNGVSLFPMYGVWPDPVIGETKILPAMRLLAETTDGAVYAWDDDVALVQNVVGAAYNQMDWAGRSLALRVGLTTNAAGLGANAEAWFRAWLALTNSVTVRKRSPSGEVLTNCVAEPFAAPFQGTAAYEFTWQGSNACGLLSRLAFQPEQYLDLTLGMVLPVVTAGTTYQLTGTNDLLTYIDAESQQPISAALTTPLYLRASQPTGQVLIVTDAARLQAVYGTAAVTGLLAALQIYAASNAVNGTFLDVGEFRAIWEANYNAGTNAFAGVYDTNGVTCLARGRYQWNTFGPDQIISYPAYLAQVIGNYALARRAACLLLVGSDNVIPYYRITCPAANWETWCYLGTSDACEWWWWYEYVNPPNAACCAAATWRNIMWSDLPYKNLNSDQYPDIAVSRLAGPPAVMKTALESAAAFQQTNHARALVALITNDSMPALCYSGVSNLWNNYFFSRADSTYLQESEGSMRPEFLAAIGQDNGLVYTIAHGNDYRDSGADGRQRLAQQGLGPLCYAAEVDFNGHHPLWFSLGCHHGSQYADDSTTNSFVAQVLAQGAAGFVGGSIYMPILGSEVLADNLFRALYGATPSKNVSQALLRATREMLFSGQDTAELVTAAVHHFGAPTLQIVFPPTNTLRRAPATPPDCVVTATQTDDAVVFELQVNSWSEKTVTTDLGIRQYLDLGGVPLTCANGYPPLPYVVASMDLDADLTVSGAPAINLGAVHEAVTNLDMPSMRLVSFASGLASFTGAGFSFTNNHPVGCATYSVIGEPDGRRTLAVCLYPVQYHPATRIATVHRDITLTFAKTNAVPAPLAQIEIARTFNQVDNSMLLVLRNVGTMDASSVQVVETIPAGSTPDPATIGNAVYDPAGNTLTWTIDILSCQVPGNFVALAYRVVFVQVATQPFAAAVSFETLGGLAGEPVHESYASPITLIAPDQDKATAVNTPLVMAHTSLTSRVSARPGATVTMAGVSDPSHGTLTNSPAGAHTYSPATDYEGEDAFIYSVTDGAGHASGRIRIVVSALPPYALPWLLLLW